IAAEDLEDHLAAHRVHQELLDSEMKSSTSEVDIAAQIVEMARSGGSGLPGNRSAAGAGDAVLVRWSDGHWYAARISQTFEDGRHQVSWAPPYTTWQPESVAADSIIPRMNQPREICNFDVAVAFVKRLLELKAEQDAEMQLEVVYHWTREENVATIVENNLRPPGSANADGTAVKVLNGEALGRGIYAATNIEFGRSYGFGLSCAFLCLAVPGIVRAEKRSGHRHRHGHPQGLCKGSDCYRHGEVRVYRRSEHVLPLFFTDAAQAARLKACAGEIAEFLISKGLGTKEKEAKKAFKVGQTVEVLWSGVYYKARIAKVHPGAYDVHWLPPYGGWPPSRAVQDAVRRYG
ncbi:Camk4, partial [Symbiodinium sp. KB8]